MLSTVTVGALALFPARGGAQPPSTEPRTPPKTAGIGVQGLAIVGMNWPVATKSLEATNLDTHPVEIGGAFQVTNIWQDLFAQVTATRISSDGERAFVDDDGTTFPLGIPLSMKATYVDFSVGWKVARGKPGRQTFWPYAGGGLGLVNFSESSPFAQPGDDFDSSKISYHLLAGVEVRLLQWLSVSGDFRYRWVPNLLGDGGVSAAFGEDDFGGPQVGVGLRLGFGGPSLHRAAPPPGTESPSDKSREPSKTPERVASSDFGTILVQAPVYLREDATREPLRVLDAGTMVKVLGENGDWIRVEFADRLLGPRVGYVQRKYIQLPK
jgi:opacity protein-like surface antigen